MSEWLAGWLPGEEDPHLVFVPLKAPCGPRCGPSSCPCGFRSESPQSTPTWPPCLHSCLPTTSSSFAGLLDHSTLSLCQSLGLCPGCGLGLERSPPQANPTHLASYPALSVCSVSRIAPFRLGSSYSFPVCPPSWPVSIFFSVCVPVPSYWGGAGGSLSGE